MEIKEINFENKKTPQILELIEKIKERVIAGEVLSLYFFHENKNQTFDWGWAGELSLVRVVGGLEYLKNRIMDDSNKNIY